MNIPLETQRKLYISGLENRIAQQSKNEDEGWILQIRYEELCEKGWSTTFELFKNAYQLGQDAALSCANEVRERSEKSQAQQPIVTDEMIAAAEEVEDLYRRGTPDTWKKVFLAMWREIPIVQSQAQQEPVAYQCVSPQGYSSIVETLNGIDQMKAQGFTTVVPLYSSQAQQESEKLSFDDNGQLVDKSQTQKEPVYQAKAEHVNWYNISKDVFDILTKDGFETRILYPAAAYEALQARIKELESKELMKSAAEAARENWSLHDKIEALQKENAELKANCAKLLSEQDYQYNKQTNEMIVRHAEQLEVAAEFCRQYQIDVAQLKQRNSGLEASRVAYANEFPLNSEGEPDVGSIHHNIRELKKQNNCLVRDKDHLQFLLDSVMLEFCPDEMTEEQMYNWSKHQRKVDTSSPEYYKSDAYKNNVKFSVDMIK